MVNSRCVTGNDWDKNVLKCFNLPLRLLLEITIRAILRTIMFKLDIQLFAVVGSSVLGKTSDHRPQLAVIELALVSVKKAVLAAYVAGNDGFASYKDCYVQARDGVREAAGCYVSICGRWSIQSNNRISPAKIKKGDIRLWLQVGAEGRGEGKGQHTGP